MKRKEIWQSAKTFCKKRGYYIALSLCILSVGTIGFFSLRSAQRKVDDTPIPNEPQLNAEDVILPKDDVPDESTETSKSSDEVKKPQQKAYTLPLEGDVLVGYDEKKPVYSKTLKDWRVHTGIDYLAPIGTEVKAVNDGTVEKIITDDLLGCTVIIKHTDGLSSVYANLQSEIKLKEGQLIAQGDTVGMVGNTAVIEVSDSPHLHFEMRSEGKNINPADVFKS